MKTIDGVDFFTCPVRSVDTDLVAEAFAVFNHYRRGFLPAAGGIYDQAERYLAMIETIEEIKTTLAAEKDLHGLKY